MMAAAPCSIALLIKAWPSVCTPLMAMNTSPEPTSRNGLGSYLTASPDLHPEPCVFQQVQCVFQSHPGYVGNSAFLLVYRFQLYLPLTVHSGAYPVGAAYSAFPGQVQGVQDLFQLAAFAIFERQQRIYLHAAL